MGCGCKRRLVFTKTKKSSGIFSHIKRQKSPFFGNLHLKVTGKKIQKISKSQPRSEMRQTPQRLRSSRLPSWDSPSAWPSSPDWQGAQDPTTGCMVGGSQWRGEIHGERNRRAQFWVKSHIWASVPCPQRTMHSPARLMEYGV